MCPEFASGRTEKDWQSAERRRHNYQTLTARTESRCDSHKNRDVFVQRDRSDNSSRRTAHLEDHVSRCSLQNKKNSVDNTDRKPRTERRRSSPSDCRHEEGRIHGNRRSRSRSPRFQKALHGSDSYRRQAERNNLLTRRPADNFSSRGNISQERSPHRVMSCHKRLSTCTQSMRPTEQDRYVFIDTRYSGNESESRKCPEISHSNDEKAHCSKYLYTDVQNSGVKKASGTRTSYHHSVDQVVGDSFSARREYTNSNRGSHAQLYEDVRHCCRFSSGCSECKDDHRGSSAVSGSRCSDNGDHKQRRSNTVCDSRHADRTNRHTVASPVYSSRSESNSMLNRDRSDEDRKKRTTDRRSSPHDRCTSVEDSAISIKKRRTDSDSQLSAGRDSHRISEIGSADKANRSSSFEESSSKKRKLSKRVPNDPAPSCVSMEKPSAAVGDGRVSSHKDDSSIFQRSQVTYFSKTDQSVVIRAADAAKCPGITDLVANRCSQASGKTDAVSSGSVVTSWPAVHGGVVLGSVAQSVMISSGNPVASSHLLRPCWPGSSVTVQRAPTISTRLCDLVPTAAVTQLPLLSTRMSSVPINVDPYKLSVSGVSLNPNIRLCTPFYPAGVQPAGGGSVVQYMMDDVYGDSPLLDEPSYSPVAAIRNSSSKLAGSSVSSVDYMRPELMQSVDDMELQKMLDVVTVAKTTLEKSLPPSCQADPNSLKQQKVMLGRFTLLMLIYFLIPFMPDTVGQATGLKHVNKKVLFQTGGVRESQGNWLTLFLLENG